MRLEGPAGGGAGLWAPSLGQGKGRAGVGYSQAEGGEQIQAPRGEIGATAWLAGAPWGYARGRARPWELGFRAWGSWGVRFRPAPLPASPVAWLARPGRAQLPGVGRDQRAESRPPPSPTETGIRGPGGRNPQPHSGCPGRHQARVGQGWGAKTGTGECGNLVLPAPGLVALFASLAVVGTPLSALEGLNGAKVGSMVGGGVVGPGCLLLETRSPSRPGEVQP